MRCVCLCVCVLLSPFLPVYLVFAFFFFIISLPPFYLIPFSSRSSSSPLLPIFLSHPSPSLSSSTYEFHFIFYTPQFFLHYYQLITIFSLTIKENQTLRYRGLTMRLTHAPRLSIITLPKPICQRGNTWALLGGRAIPA